ncbi:hypothetical protein DINM_004637 [Dirofilaria immitis]|nr:hypothetical protein [Dirofilaria immitis]
MLGLPIIIFIMHIAIFNNLRRKRIAISFSRPGEFQNISCMSQIYKRTSITKLTSANNEASKNEISILIQGAIYCITAELEVLSFKFLRKIPAASFNDKIYICLNIVVNCLIICLGATQPTKISKKHLQNDISSPIAQAPTTTSLLSTSVRDSEARQLASFNWNTQYILEASIDLIKERINTTTASKTFHSMVNGNPSSGILQELQISCTIFTDSNYCDLSTSTICFMYGFIQYYNTISQSSFWLCRSLFASILLLFTPLNYYCRTELELSSNTSSKFSINP